MVRGGWDQSALEAAVDLVVGGAGYRPAEAATGVSAATIKRYAVSLGLVGTYRVGKGRPRVAESGLTPALEAIAGGMSVTGAAEAAGVAVSTLRRRLLEQRLGVCHERKRRQTALSPAEREEIRVGIQAGQSDAAIARRIGRHRGSVGRDIAANGGRGGYRAVAAEARAEHNAKRAKPGWTQSRPGLWEEVQALIRTKKWSPEQISRRLRCDHPSRATVVGVTRGDLSGHLRASQRRAAQGVGGMSAFGSSRPPVAHQDLSPARQDPGHGQHLPAAGPGPRPGRSRPLGRRPDHRRPTGPARWPAWWSAPPASAC